MAILLQEHYAIILFFVIMNSNRSAHQKIFLSKITKKIDQKKFNILIYIKKYKYLTNFIFSALKC